LIQLANQLLAVSVPAFDQLISELIALSAAEHEDAALFASSTVTGGPAAILSVPNITTMNCQNDANGGNLAFSDIVGMLAKMAAVKGKPPFAWYMSPRTFWSRVVSMVDLNSRPIFIPTFSSGLQAAPQGQFYQGFLFGWPVWVCPGIQENESIGSGSNQSHVLLTSPKYVHLAQSAAVSIAISTEFAFAQNMTSIRATQELDSAVSPPAGMIALLGVN
jgi:HK97 family phage major capsid protein